MTNYNKAKAKLTSGGRSVQLNLTRCDESGVATARFQITLPRRVFEEALRSATIEAPWRDFFPRRR